MEHQIFNKISKYKIPLFLRIIIFIVLLILWIIFILLPLPASAPIGILIIIFWIIFIISAKNIKFIRKIRKWLFYFMKNIIDKKIRNHKIKDIKKHIKQIFKNKK